MTSIVTKTGDDGTTGLFGGSRISKASPQLHACGTVDELNAIIGLVLAEEDLPTTLRDHLGSLQHILFRLGADIAAAAPMPIKHIDAEDVALIDEWIASLECSLPPLQHFIIPGGCRAAAILHHARTVCRRTERWAVALAEKEAVNPQARIFLNRLSDHLFLAARAMNHHQKQRETAVTYTTTFPPRRGGVCPPLPLRKGGGAGGEGFSSPLSPSPPSPLPLR